MTSNNNNIDLVDIKEFIDFMKAHIINKDDKTTPITHTLLGPLHNDYAKFRGKFNIEGLDYDKFIKLYKSVVGKMDLHIVERPNKVGPLVWDIDFKTSKQNNRRQYSDNI